MFVRTEYLRKGKTSPPDSGKDHWHACVALFAYMFFKFLDLSLHVIGWKRSRWEWFLFFNIFMCNPLAALSGTCQDTKMKIFAKIVHGWKPLSVFGKKDLRCLKRFSTPLSLHKKWGLRLRISSVNETNSAGNCGFGHIYSRKLWWETSFFMQCLDVGQCSPLFQCFSYSAGISEEHWKNLNEVKHG